MVCASATTEPVAAVGVPPVPPALPTAVTASPTATDVAVPSLAVVRPDAPDSCSTATSSVASVPTTAAVYVLPVDTTVTEIDVDPATTWLFVRISPDAVSTMPVPAAFPAP